MNCANSELRRPRPDHAALRTGISRITGCCMSGVSATDGGGRIERGLRPCCLLPVVTDRSPSRRRSTGILPRPPSSFAPNRRPRLSANRKEVPAGIQLGNAPSRTPPGECASRWHAAKEKRRQKSREGDGTGPRCCQVWRHRIGTALLELAGRTLRGGGLTHCRAARMLGTNISSVERLLASARVISGTCTPNERVQDGRFALVDANVLVTTNNQ